MHAVLSYACASLRASVVGLGVRAGGQSLALTHSLARDIRKPTSTDKMQAFELKTSTDDPEVLPDSGENIVVGGANR